MQVKLEKITHFFGERLIFKDVSFNLETGKVYLLKGANGSGKSTLLKIIAGLLAPTQGKVINDFPKSKIGYLAHQPFLYSYLTAEENLFFFAKIYQLDPSLQDIYKYLKEVGLKIFAKEKVKNFSRGMKQRLGLARLFMLDPDLILLDEPETGLDKEFRAFLEEKIKELKRQNKIVLWISHLDSVEEPDVELIIKQKRVEKVER